MNSVIFAKEIEMSHASQKSHEGFARATPFLDDDSPIEGSVALLAKLLAGFRPPAADSKRSTKTPKTRLLRIRIVDDKNIAEHTIEIGAQKAYLAKATAKTRGKGGTTATAAEVVMGKKTFIDIAAGEVSPVYAFLAGQLRVCGSTVLAAALMRHIALGPGKTQPCGD